MTRLVLASASPRRSELLHLLGIPFEVVVPRGEEAAVSAVDAMEQASRLARAKAFSVPLQAAEAVIVAADTLVVFDGRVLGKPEDAAAAQRVLAGLRGRQHQVVTGLAVLSPSAEAPIVDAVETQVWMRHYRDEEVAAYVARGEPLDKAGSYAIQDPLFDPVERIEGCYANVMGLPLCHLFVILEGIGLAPPATPQRACEAHTGQTCPVAEAVLALRNR